MTQLSQFDIQVIIAKAIGDELSRDEIWEHFAKQTEQHEREFIPELVDLFNAQRTAVEARMKARPYMRRMFRRKSRQSDDYVDYLFKPEEWAARFETTALPFETASLAQGATEALREVTAGIEFNVRDPRVVDMLNQKVHKFSFEVNATTLKDLKLQFAQGVEAGEGIPQLRQRVQHVFDIAETSRAETIARTEVIGTYNKGTQEGYVQSKVVKEKTWLSSRDANVRPSHAAADGQTVPLTDSFNVGGTSLEHPGDWGGSAAEIINCRCSMTAVVE